MRDVLLRIRFMFGHLYRRYRGTFHPHMGAPPYPKKIQRMVRWSDDPVRYATVALALERIRKESIKGAIAEVGVWRGQMSQFLHQQMPERMLYLFDTFQGFPDQTDGRFRDTNIETVKTRIGDLSNIEFRVGIFPDTAKGLEQETFSFVFFDADKYEAAMASFEFFYPRLSLGGYFVLHDFNSPESEGGVSKAVHDFRHEKPERLIEIPDVCGTVVFRKC